MPSSCFSCFECFHPPIRLCNLYVCITFCQCLVTHHHPWIATTSVLRISSILAKCKSNPRSYPSSNIRLSRGPHHLSRPTCAAWYPVTVLAFPPIPPDDPDLVSTPTDNSESSTIIVILSTSTHDEPPLQCSHRHVNHAVSSRVRFSAGMTREPSYDDGRSGWSNQRSYVICGLIAITIVDSYF